MDRDGPVNSLLRYSVVSGDALRQFSIHPRSGEISVTSALDREEVCGPGPSGSLSPDQQGLILLSSLLYRSLTTP